MTVDTEGSLMGPLGGTVQLQIHSADAADAWQLRAIELRGPGSSGPVHVFEAGTPGFITTEGRTVLSPLGTLGAVLPVPPGYTHLDLTIRLHGTSPEGAWAVSEMELTAASMASLPATAPLTTEEGLPSAAQALFYLEWSLAQPAYASEELEAAGYYTLKAARLGGAGGAP